MQHCQQAHHLGSPAALVLGTFQRGHTVCLHLHQLDSSVQMEFVGMEVGVLGCEVVMPSDCQLWGWGLVGAVLGSTGHCLNGGLE